MATVASLVRSSDYSGRMQFIDYQNTYKDNNKEFLRGDMYELKVINAPKIVYYPGDDIINARLNSVQVGIDYSATGITKQMRGGWRIEQRTNQSTSGTITLNFVDREDASITYFVTDWRNKIADPETRYSFRKDDLVADLQLIITNAQRIDVKTLTFYNCQFQDAPLNENGDLDSESDRADVSLTLTFEHYSREHNNI
jgi:hypothetical protein